ncbi:hypothetical protein [Lysinibacillus sphaericus]|uniref:Uncharacterized protein n=1 Tax=Lysinibacillus sphaericus TaxID=1421 RepID=A0A6G9ZZX7_LYSSH|nr:hypothetical protein [Lysinibacillus sphaericus]QIS31271.1 hypothetical protein [Lysinibacillus sphaericus]QPA61346.1 hypothetical protein INQ55_23745 [Lysinibacillus sphaericus]
MDKILIACYVVVFIFIGIFYYINSPQNNKLTNFKLVESSTYSYLEFESNNEIMKININNISNMVLTDKNYSYYSYFRPHYTIHFTEKDYERFFRENDNDKGNFAK